MVRFSTRYVPRLSCYIILLLCHDFVAGGRGPEQPRFTFFQPVPTESNRIVYGVSVLPGQALVIERQFLSGAWEHATLPAVPFGQEGSNPVTDVVVVLRYKFLSGKTSENAFTALSATQLNPKVEENFVGIPRCWKSNRHNRGKRSRREGRNLRPPSSPSLATPTCDLVCERDEHPRQKRSWWESYSEVSWKTNSQWWESYSKVSWKTNSQWTASWRFFNFFLFSLTLRNPPYYSLSHTYDNCRCQRHHSNQIERTANNSRVVPCLRGRRVARGQSQGDQARSQRIPGHDEVQDSLQKRR